MSTLFEYYNTGDDRSDELYLYWWKAQTFTPLITHDCSLIKLKLARYGGLPGICTVSISTADANGKPTTDYLATKTFDGNTLPLDPLTEWREIEWDTEITLEKDVMYAIVLRALNATALKKLRWRMRLFAAQYPRGTALSSNMSGSSWSLYYSIDFMFEEWGDDIPGDRLYPKAFTGSHRNIKPVTSNYRNIKSFTGGG